MTLRSYLQSTVIKAMFGGRILRLLREKTMSNLFRGRMFSVTL